MQTRVDAPASSELLTAGTKAPTFALQDQSGALKTLEDAAGKAVVLYFYPKDATPGCTVEARGFRDSYDVLSGAGATVYGVSTDSVASHASFAEDENLPFSLLSDEGGKLAAAYGVSVKMGFTSRVTFLIGADGVIKKVYPNVTPSSHADEILADLKAL